MGKIACTLTLEEGETMIMVIISCSSSCSDIIVPSDPYLQLCFFEIKSWSINILVVTIVFL